MTCAIYCRLSKEDAAANAAPNTPRESESIQNQKNLLVGHAVQQGWEIYGIYCDDDYSGADRDRPQWNEMLRAARTGRVQIILCKNQSRFTRDLEMVEKYIHGLFPLWGVRFVALLDNVDTAVRGNKKARQINGLINEWYLEDLSENVRAVLDQKRRAGKFIGSFPVYGYQKDPADHNHLIIDEAAAENVRLIFRLYLGGAGTRHIAYQLNQSGIPNPAQYKRAKGWNYVNGGERAGRGLWTHVTVSRILRGEVYTGTLVQGTRRKASYKSKKLLEIPREQWTRVEGTHEAIIDRAAFDAAGQRLALRTRSSGLGETHVLSGKVRCEACGQKMIKLSNQYKGVRCYYLQCATYAATRKQPLCTKHGIRLDLLTGAVETRIRALVGALYTPGELSRFRSGEYTEDRSRALEREIAAADQRIAKLSGAIRSLYLDKVEGLLTAGQFAELHSGFLAEKSALEQATQLLRTRLGELERRGAAESGTAARVGELLRLDSIGHALYDLLVEAVELGERDPVKNTQAVHIIWKL